MESFKSCVTFLVALFYCTTLFSQFNGISILDVKTGIVTEAVNLGNASAYNPTFSNNGKKLAFDSFGDYTGIYITDLSTGNTNTLDGGFDGNDASWSPDGENIVFDRYGYEILFVSASGGNPEFITYGTDPEWNNTSEKIVYNEFGTLKTVNIDGSGETTISLFGINPSWSPNGNHIAFSDGESLWVVNVDDYGNVLGSPYQITFDGSDIYNQQPSWSNNSKSLVFHSNRTTTDFEFEIWSINIADGAISHLTGFDHVGDFDPCFSKNGKYVAFSTQGEELSLAPLKKSSAKMGQNSPNPFTNNTAFLLEVEKSGHVQVLVRDQMGRTIDVLVNAKLDAGVHELEWNPSTHNIALTSGIYTIQMITSEGIQTKQIIYNRN